MSIFGKFFGSNEAKVAAAVAAAVSAEGALQNPAEAASNHHKGIVDANQTARVEVMKDPEKMLKMGAEWAAQEAAHQAEGGGIEKGPDNVFTGPNGAQVYFEDNTGSASGTGELVAVVKLVEGIEKKFILKAKDQKEIEPTSTGKIPYEYSMVGPLEDLEAQADLRMASK
jgi:hypothetical protein